jgi:succinyl-CoA synthetase beta subunit
MLKEYAQNYHMRLYEFEGAELFRREGIPIPDSALASSPEEAREKAGQIGLPVVVKAQVLSGGRWLAGGVHVAETLSEAEEYARRILSSVIKGLPVQQVMVVRKINSDREYYLSVTPDDYNGYPVAILSAEGGVAINATAREKPEVVVSRPVSISKGLSLNDAIMMTREAGLIGPEQNGVASILHSLYRLFRKYDATIAEINPLVRTKDGKYIALDSKVEIDDSGLFRHTELNISQQSRLLNPLERKGKQIGVTYVDLDGDIAMISSGAGLGMATMDVIGKRAKAANFLETGGAITADLLYKVMDLIFQKPGIKALFINIYGGINPIHEGAQGIARYIKEHDIKVPIVAKALGNHQEETWEIFKACGINVTDGVSTEEGIDLLMRLMGKQS